MLQSETIMNDTPDSDTLGGRIWRARDALEMSTAQLARRLGVKTETIAAWEGDRSEPRANRLIMLAGVLGVSPTWLLSGIGEAPTAQTLDSAVTMVKAQFTKLKQQHERTALALEALDREIGRLDRRLQEPEA